MTTPFQSLSRFVAFVATLMASSPLHASSYGCSDLDDVVSQPVEGQDGYFFHKVKFKNVQPFSEQSLDFLEAFDKALEAAGTRLIYLPLAPKAVYLPEWLPKDVGRYRYYHEAAAENYAGVIEALQARSIDTLDVTDALRDPFLPEPPFFRADHHWTSAGARAVAEAVADLITATPEYQGLDKTSFSTTSDGVREIDSAMLDAIQRACTENLPRNTTEHFRTEEVLSSDLGGGLFGDAPRTQITVIGTSFSAERYANFDGFLAEKTSLRVGNYAVTGGNQFGALLAYLTSDAFRDDPPNFLVWENPLYLNLGLFGDQPLIEALVAVAGTCQPVEIDPSSTAQRLVLTPPAEMQTAATALFVDFGDPTDREIEVRFLEDGEARRTLRVVRSPRAPAQGRFFVSLNPARSLSADSIAVTGDRPFGAVSTIAFCQLNTNGW